MKVVGAVRFYNLRGLPLLLLADVEEVPMRVGTARLRDLKNFLMILQLLLLAAVGLILIRAEYRRNQFAS